MNADIMSIALSHGQHSPRLDCSRDPRDNHFREKNSCIYENMSFSCAKSFFNLHG